MLFVKNIRGYWSILVLLLFLVLTGCGIAIKDNPLTGKNTDERIIMSLQDTYPEHQFTVVKSFDEKKDEGIFADENGIEFRVMNVTLNNSYHFGCTDEYLYTLLNMQGYVEKAEDIVKKYGLEWRCVVRPATIVQLDDNVDYLCLANMVLEILNCVETPKVVYPDTEFRTGEVNYYSIPSWGIFVCNVEDISIATLTGTKFYFEDKSKSPEELAERMEQTTIDMYERHKKWEERQKQNE